MDYAAAVFHYSLPQYLLVELERIQKRALSIIFPCYPYKDACKIINLDDLGTHHDKLCSNLFENILKDPYHKLYDLLPERCENTKYNLWHSRMFDLQKYRTNRFRALLSYRVALGRTQKNF